jgi:hypothetical protein
MRADLIQRLQQRGMATHKIAALLELGGEALAEQWLDQHDTTVKETGPMTGQRDPRVARAAAVFEVTLKEALPGAPEAIEDVLWDFWVNDPARAQLLLDRVKDAPARASLVGGVSAALHLDQAPAAQQTTKTTRAAFYDAVMADAAKVTR